MVAAQLVIRAAVGRSQIEVLGSSAVLLHPEQNTDKAPIIRRSFRSRSTRDIYFDDSILKVKVVHQCNPIGRGRRLLRLWGGQRSKVNGVLPMIIRHLGLYINPIQVLQRVESRID